MRYVSFLSLCLLLTVASSSSLDAETFCVKKKVKVSQTGRINLAKSVQLAPDGCPKGFAALEPDINTAGVQGPPGPLVTTLPSGDTLKGFYITDLGSPSPAAHQTHGTISFTFPLSQDPTAHYIRIGSTPPVECPGSAESPEASPGHLCVYEIVTFNTVTTLVNVSNKYGAAVVANRDQNLFNFYSRGTWAVTGN